MILERMSAVLILHWPPVPPGAAQRIGATAKGTSWWGEAQVSAWWEH